MYTWFVKILLILKLYRYVNWDYVTRYQKLSSENLEKLQEYLDWILVSQYQHLSSQDLEKFENRLHWRTISICQKLAKEDLERFKDKIDMDIQERFHKEKTLEQKKAEMSNYAERHNLKFDGQFLYAFRNHDSFGRGAYNPTTRYKRGKYYRDWHVDMDPYVMNSFGLGIWPIGNTRVKVSVQDWGLEVPHDNGKCRVWGFTVL